MDQIPMKNQASPPANTQSGSIFVWIFVMVALFAALSFALSKGSRTGAASISAEKSRLAANEVLDYARAVQTVVNTMMIDGCKIEEISFYSDRWPTPSDYDNPNSLNADGNYKCHVFNPAGGGIRFQTVPQGFPVGSEYYFTAFTAIHNVGTDLKTDLVMILRLPDANFCQGMNSVLGVSSYARDAYEYNKPYKGVFNDGVSYMVGDDDQNPQYVAGKTAACMKAFEVAGGFPQPTDTYYFYYVLRPR